MAALKRFATRPAIRISPRKIRPHRSTQSTIQKIPPSPTPTGWRTSSRRLDCYHFRRRPRRSSTRRATSISRSSSTNSNSTRRQIRRAIGRTASTGLRLPASSQVHTSIKVLRAAASITIRAASAPACPVRIRSRSTRKISSRSPTCTRRSIRRKIANRISTRSARSRRESTASATNSRTSSALAPSARKRIRPRNRERSYRSHRVAPAAI